MKIYAFVLSIVTVTSVAFADSDVQSMRHLRARQEHKKGRAPVTPITIAAPEDNRSTSGTCCSYYVQLLNPRFNVNGECEAAAKNGKVFDFSIPSSDFMGKFKCESKDSQSEIIHCCSFDFAAPPSCPTDLCASWNGASDRNIQPENSSSSNNPASVTGPGNSVNILPPSNVVNNPAPGNSENTPGNGGSKAAPGNSGNNPPTGSPPGNSENNPGNGGSNAAPGNSGNTPPTGSPPGNSENTPGNGGSNAAPGNSGNTPPTGSPPGNRGSTP
jgi:hypothetical protein